MNIGLIKGANYNYLIDTGLGSGSVEPVLEYLGDDKKPVAVINTHSHWDHVWGNWVFKDNIIIAHVKCRELIDRDWNEDNRRYSQLLNEKADGKAYKCLPNFLFNDFISFPDDSINIFYTPGHDIDCISVYDELDKVLYAGDNIGDTMDSIIPHIGTDTETFRKTLDIYKKCDFEVCISGHNKPQTKGLIERMEKALSILDRP